MADHTFLLTAEEQSAVEALIDKLDELNSDPQFDYVLLGPIPVTDIDGFELLGFLKQGDDLSWRFTRDLADTMGPLPLMRRQHPDGEQHV